MGVFLIEKISTQKISDLVINAFFDAITQGEIQIGETLASERDLSEKLGISRGSLREGLSILEYLGVLASEGKRKIVSQDYDVVQKALEIVKVSTQTENDIITDVAEFRREIELLIVKIACKKATPKNIDNIKKSIELLENGVDNPAADYNFHTALAEATQNGFIVAIEELLISMTKNITASLIDYPGRREHILDEQKSLLKAVEEKNVELGQAIMLKHLFFLERTMGIITSFRDPSSEESNREFIPTPY